MVARGKKLWSVRLLGMFLMFLLFTALPANCDRIFRLSHMTGRLRKSYLSSKRAYLGTVFNSSQYKGWDGCMRYSCSSRSCQNILHSTARIVMDAMDRANLDWHITGGTLLGVVRQNSLSPNAVDMDVDIAVEGRAFDEIARPGSHFIMQLNALDYHAFLDDGDDPELMRVCVGRDFPGLLEDTKNVTGPYYDNYKYVDVYPVKSTNDQGHSRVGGSKKWVLPNDDIYPTIKTDFKGSTIRMPAHPERILRRGYGNWTIVRPSKHGR